ncbi:hypothetical protein NQZ68_037234 [Dissostichus eleginoides]|nr:hypothetical protein NQZ68_037234 [Dissostichus eleginoides]
MTLRRAAQPVQDGPPQLVIVVSRGRWQAVRNQLCPPGEQGQQPQQPTPPPSTHTPPRPITGGLPGGRTLQQLLQESTVLALGSINFQQSLALLAL